MIVVNPCSTPEHPEETLCADGSCTVDTLCSAVALPSAGGRANQPPTIALVGSPEVVIPVNSMYGMCAPGAPLDAACDRGCTASDPEDGNLAAGAP